MISFPAIVFHKEGSWFETIQSENLLKNRFLSIDSFRVMSIFGSDLIFLRPFNSDPEPCILRFWIMVCSPVRDLPNSSFEISHFHDGIIVMNWSLDKHPIRCRVGIPIIQKYDLNSDSSIKDLFQWSWRVSIISVYVCPLSMIGASVSVVQSFS